MKNKYTWKKVMKKEELRDEIAMDTKNNTYSYNESGERYVCMYGGEWQVFGKK